MDQITRRRTDDVGAQKLPGFLVRQKFHKALRNQVRFGPAIAHERKLANFVGAALFLQRLFGQTHCGDLGRCVDHTRNDRIVHMAMPPGDLLSDRHAFVFRLMGQHWPFGDIANGVDAGDIGLPACVGHHEAALSRNAQRLQPQAFGIGPPSCRHQNDIRIYLMLAFILALLIGDFQLALQLGDACDGGAQLELEALLGQDPAEGLGDFLVHARCNLIEKLDHRHFGAQTTPDRAKLKPDDTAADHDQLFRNLRQLQRPGRGDDPFLIHINERQ